MTRRTQGRATRGHRSGGLSSSLGAALLPAVLLLSGCGGGVEPGALPRPGSGPPRPQDVYRAAGLLTGPATFPAVATFPTLAGPGDSTLVLFGLSLPNSALRFERDEDGFVASYLVSLRFLRDGETVRSIDRTERVRVAEYGETGLTRETVVFQTATPLEPGEYVLSLRVRDGLSARGFEATDTLLVPRYGPGPPDSVSLAPPLPVYRATPRTARGAVPGLVLNPRHAVPYGLGSLLLYLEGYGDGAVRVEVADGDGRVSWARDVVLEGGTGMAAGLVEVPADSLPLGLLTVTASTASGARARTPALVSLSEEWLASNLEEALGLLRYIATAEELEGLRSGTPRERREAWDRFWERRDPVPATPTNEYLEEFLDRVRVAAREFGEGGRAGWLTDRGEVYIVLGPPTEYRALSRSGQPGMVGEPDAVEWQYHRVPGGGRLSLLFVDRNGFGSFRLTPASASAFRAVARRIQQAHARR